MPRIRRGKLGPKLKKKSPHAALQGFNSAKLLQIRNVDL